VQGEKACPPSRKDFLLSDIFREVEEEVRRERLEKLWKEYGDYIIAGAALIVIAVAGLQLWRHYEDGQRLKASDAYQVAEQAFENNSPQIAEAAFAQLAKEAPGGYASVARLQEADALLASGRKDDAIALYKQIAGADDPVLGAVARLRAAWAIADTTSKSDIETLLAPLTDPTSPWHYAAREVLAYEDYRTGQLKQAAGEYEKLGADTNAPSGVRQRSMAMAVYLKAGGDQNVGTVPPPPTAPHPAQTAPAAPTSNGPKPK
jgi:hypothetical protein